MRPPICEVCGDEFDPDAGSQVTFPPAPNRSGRPDRSDDRRSEPRGPEPVGHPPDVGWFCARHVTDARRLAPTTNLARVVQVLARNDPRQRCEVCGERFWSRTGAAVGFARTAAGSAYHQARIAGEEIGIHPDEGWFCHRHADPALRIRHLTKAEAKRELTPTDRAPYEYDERPPSTDPARDEQRPPLRGPFRPVDDGGLDDAPEARFAIAPRSAAEADALLRDALPTLAAAFGPGPTRNGGSTSSADVTPDDVIGAPPGTVASVSHRPHQIADATVFAIRTIFRQGERAGPIVGSSSRLLVQHRQRSLVELAFRPERPWRRADDGELLLDTLSVRRSPELDDDVDAVVEHVVRQIRAAGAEPVDDPLDPAPDLVGVDLGGGRLVRPRLRGAASGIEWSRSIDLAEARDRLVAGLPAVLQALGQPGSLALEATTRRSWTPMDGAGPPHCPYTDHWRWHGASDTVTASIDASSAHWSDDAPSNTAASLTVEVDGDVVVSLSYHQRLDSGDGRSTVRLRRPTTAAVVAAVVRLFPDGST